VEATAPLSETWLLLFQVGCGTVVHVFLVIVLNPHTL
jgi:hypothetical protein